MKNKKIMFVCQYFYPEKISSGMLPYELACGLSDEGHDVSALVGYPKEYSDLKNLRKKEIINNLSIHRISYIQAARSNFAGRIINYLSFCLAILLHFNSFRKIDQCICYTNPPFLPFVVAILSKVFKFDFFFEVYDLYPDVANRSGVIREDSALSRLMTLATNFAMKQAKKVIVLSSEMKKYIMTHKTIEEGKICIIPNWYQGQAQKKYVDNEKLTILYGGNMGLLQELDTLVDAMITLKNHPKIEFIIAGHGINKDKVKVAKEEYRIDNCFIYDFLPKEDYDRLMEKADIAVVSLKDFGYGLGSPSKVYSYLAMGLPIIAIMPEDTDIVRDIKVNQNGIFVREGESNKIVDFLTYIQENNMCLQKMRTNSYNLFYRKYHFSNSLAKFSDLLKE